jgi:hypothetical protein
MRGSEMMEVCMSGFVEHRRAILLAVEMHRSDDWPACIDENTKRRGFFLGCEGFSNKTVFLVMRILCGFCAKGQKFVRIRLEERFYNAFQNNEDSYAQIREVITKINTKNKFSFHCRDSMTPSTN